MKPHPRIRKTVKWAGLVLNLALLAMWITSGWWWLYWQWNYRGDHIWLGYGLATVGFSRPDQPFISTTWPEFSVQQMRSVREPYLQMLQFSAESYGGRARGVAVTVPAWTLLIVASLPTAIAWRSDKQARRRERPYCCFRCGYDRRGLAAGAECPECGAAAAPAPQRT